MTIKSYTITEEGDEQITGFHLAGDLVGFDAIINTEHPSFAQALETSMVCEIPYETLDDLSGKMPNLRQQMMRLMSGEIKGDQEMILLLSKKNAEERLAAFIYNLSRRFAQRGFSPREFRLTMTRGDIGNYLGLTVETISRLLGRFQKSGMLAVKANISPSKIWNSWRHWPVKYLHCHRISNSFTSSIFGCRKTHQTGLFRSDANISYIPAPVWFIFIDTYPAPRGEMNV